MLDLSLYNKALPLLRGGDVVMFAGKRSSPLDALIDFVSRSRLTHSAMVYEPTLTIEGKVQTELHIVESTILNGVDGVQINPLAARLDGNDGVALFRLKDETRAAIDWTKLWACAIAKVGRDKYNIAELFEYVARDLPFVDAIPRIYQPTPHREVCSELVTDLLQAGGATPGANPALTSPQKLAEFAIYRDIILLFGKLSPVRNFNTRQ